MDLYSGRDFVITDEVIIRGHETYQASAVTSAKIWELTDAEDGTGERRQLVKFGAGTALVGLLVFASSLGNSSLVAAIVGLLLLTLGALTVKYTWGADPKYRGHRNVEVTLSSGEQFSLRATSEDEAQAICDAVHRAASSASRSKRGASVAEELAKLAALRDSGVLSGEDWERAKDLFLGKGPDQRRVAIEHLRQLHGLFKAGVLSESEFNSKKWDILAGSSKAAG